nr:MAG TPA: hypothetical protein [Caudoviricetes sp.]
MRNVGATVPISRRRHSVPHGRPRGLPRSAGPDWETPMRNTVLAISISLRERVSIRETLSPLDEPSTFREKRKGGGRSGGSARRDAADPPPAPSGRQGYRLSW